MKHRITYSSISAVLLLALSGCGKGGSNVRDVLGLDRTSPDEFAVVSRPPLTVPKEFYLLPPGAGAETPDAARADMQAKKVLEAEITLPEVPSPDETLRAVDASEVLGTSGANDLRLSIPEPIITTQETDVPVASVSTNDLPSTAEEQLLSRTGANDADPDIRSKLKQEAWETKQSAESESVWDALKGENTVMDEAVVDAPQEAERLVSNKEEGKAANEGDVKLDDPADDTPLQRMMKWF